MKITLVGKTLFQGHYEREEAIIRKSGFEFDAVDVTSDEDYIEKCKDADGLLIVMQKTPKAVIEHLDRCKVMVRYGVGFDVIDVDACTAKGIAVCNIPDYCQQEVAGQAMALLLDCMRAISYQDRRIRNGGNPHSVYPMHRFSSMTLGFCGFGNIARMTSKYASGFGFRQIGYDPYVDEETFRSMGVEKVDMQELCRQSDAITVHTPLNESTHHLISKREFDSMKKGMIIVNTSRGEVICEDALLDAIDAGIVKAAGLDVSETENFSPDCRIMKYETVILTPHTGASGVESSIELSEKVAQVAISVLKGERPFCIVNKEIIKS